MIRPRRNTSHSAFTIIELLVVIAVIGILAAIVLISYGSWRTSVATSSLKSDLEHAASAMESARTFDNSYPLAIPSTFSASADNTITLTLPDAKSFCIDGTTSRSATILYYIDNLAKTATEGTCATRTNMPAPSPVSNVSFTNSPPSITVNWALASPNYANQYLVQCALDPALITGLIEKTVSGGGTTTAVLNGSNGTDTYYCRVRAVNDGGQSDWVSDGPIVNQGNVTTLAGSGVAGFADGTGTSAQLNYPYSVAVDSSGNVYVADTGNNRIRKITASGVVSTLAGSGTAGFANGSGASAQFNQPFGVAVDSSGNVYVADTGNNRIRKITPGGVVSTLAGSGTNGSADGSGATAQFYWPYGVAADNSGNIYVADDGNNRIRKITASGVVSTLAGSGTAGFADGSGTSAQFNAPTRIAVDNSGNIYVADSQNNRIRKITPGGVVSTLAGSGTAGFADGSGTSAQFNAPIDVAVDKSGNVYVPDNNRIRKITPGGVVSTLAGSGTAGFADGSKDTARFNQPYGVAVDSSGNVYVADAFNHRIRKIQ